MRRWFSSRLYCLILGLAIGVFFAAGPQMAELSAGAHAASPRPPVAKRGQIDVSGWDFARGPVQLDGEWELYFGQLLEPSDFAGLESNVGFSSRQTAGPRLTGYVTVPGSWQAIAGGGPVPPRHGVATYRLIVHGVPLSADVFSSPPSQPSPRSLWLLEMPYARTAYRLWVNGELVAANGAVSADSRAMRPEYRPTLAPIAPATMLGQGGFQQALPDGAPQTPTEGSLEIIIQVSNAHFRAGGLPRSILLGPAELVARNHRARLVSQMFLIGALGLMAMTYGVMYAGQRSERSMLYFALLSAAIAVRSFFMGELPVQIVLPGFPWEIQLRMEYFTGYLGTAVFMLLLQSLYPRDVLRWVTWLYLAVGAVGCALVTIFPVRITSLLVPYHTILAFLAVPYTLYVLVRAALRRRPASQYTLVGGLIFLTTVVLSMLHYNQLWIELDLVPHGLFALVLSQALALSQRYSAAFRRASELAVENGQLLDEARQQLTERNRLYRLLCEQDEKTRRQIAEALHGSAQTRLLQAAQTLEQAALLAENDPREAAKLIRSAGHLVEEVREKDIREASHRLHPAAIAAGLVAAIDVLCRQLLSELDVDLEVDPRLADLDDPGGAGIHESIRLALYRIVEEAVNNIRRHALAKRVTISLGLKPAKTGGGDDWSIELKVTDDGVGFDPSAVRDGFGLKLIAARAADLDGQWDIISAPGQGTIVTVTVPLRLHEPLPWATPL